MIIVFIGRLSQMKLEQKKILLLDTTLRDGEQTPGVAFTPEQKLCIAKKLDEANVDIIEGGSAIASDAEARALKMLAKEKLNADISSFARIIIKDIDAVVKTEINTISIVAPASDLHIEKKLRTTKEQLVDKTVECISYAKSHGLKVELLAEDGSRADKEFLAKLFSEAEQAHADRVTVCDTVGVLCPEKTTELFSFLSQRIRIPLGIHCHNDLGLSVANTFAAIRAGAGEAHGTINGIGERTGNTPLEEIAFGLWYFYNVNTMKLDKIYELSKLVESFSKVPVAHNKPLVGKNAFLHESGIHVDGILKEARTYEPFNPETIGRKRQFVIGKHSGSKAIKLKLDEMGISVSDEQLNAIVECVKRIGDSGKQVTDADFQVIVFDVLKQNFQRKIILKELVVVTGNNISPTASVKLAVNGREELASAVGNGPVDAALKAISEIVKSKYSLVEYHVDAITGGTDALVDVRVIMRSNNKEVSASAADTDIVMASVEAVLRALDLLM